MIPRSHPLFQEFKIWQTLNDIKVLGREKKRNVLSANESRALYPEEKEILARELAVKENLKKTDVLKLLFENPQELDLNFKQIDGNRTGFSLFSAYGKMIEKYGYEPLDFKKSAEEIIGQLRTIFTDLGWNTDLFTIDLTKEGKEFEMQPYFRLWHLLYSFEGDNTPTGNGKLIEKIMQLCGVEKDYAVDLANLSFQDDYGSLSAKAIKGFYPI